MKVFAKKYVFQSAFDKVFAVTSKSTTTPVLQNVLMKLNSDKHLCTLIGSDSEITVVANLEQVDIEGEGNILLPPKAYDIIKNCSDSDIQISLNENVIAIDSEQTHWELKQDQLPYPEFEAVFAAGTKISKVVLSSVLSIVRPAVTSENLRPTYSYIQIKDNLIRATDGSKFIQTKFPYPIEGLISNRTIPEIIRAIKLMALEDVYFGQDERFYIFRFDADYLFVTKSVSEYPDVESLVLKPVALYKNVMSCDRKLLMDAAKRVSITADEDTNYLVMTLIANRLELSSLDKFGNKSHEMVDVYWKGEEYKFGVNCNHLIDILSALSGAACSIGFDESSSKLCSLCFKDEEVLAVIVQLRIDLGEAAKGSNRIRAAQADPAGWKKKRKPKEVEKLEEVSIEEVPEEEDDDEIASEDMNFLEE